MAKLVFRADRFTWVFRLQFVVALLIFTFLTLSPEPSLSTAGNDKIWHFMGNLLFFLSARIAMFRLSSIWFALGFVLFYGAAMELAQNLVPQRLFDVRDLIANALGVAAGLLLVIVTQWVWRRLQPIPDVDDHAQP